MGIVAVFLLAVALAMDCFAVSITCGIIQKRMGAQVWLMAFLFGLFQALMPCIGWKAASLFSQQISAYDHWIAAGALFAVAIKMFIDGSHEEKETATLNPSNCFVLLTLAVATSIDAMAVGLSFVGMGLNHFSDILFPVVTIGLVSFLLTFCGKYIGIRLGLRFNWPAEQFGGVILILIGLKVLYEHLMV